MRSRLYLSLCSKSKYCNLHARLVVRRWLGTYNRRKRSIWPSFWMHLKRSLCPNTLRRANIPVLPSASNILISVKEIIPRLNLRASFLRPRQRRKQFRSAQFFLRPRHKLPNIFFAYCYHLGCLRMAYLEYLYRSNFSKNNSAFTVDVINGFLFSERVREMVR